jgi:FkbM family methyltransferase
VSYNIIREEDWYRIEGDTAFSSILEGYPKYEEVFKKFLGETGGSAVQAGGYCGVFPCSMASFFDRVYTFEPDPANFTCLILNSMKVGGKVFAFNSLLGNRHRMQGLTNLVATNRGMNVAAPYGHIPTLLIDDLKAQDVRYIQLDTEGSEYEILEGATETITNWKPLISVEDNNQNIRELLENLGYKEVATVYRDTFYDWNA